MRDGGGGLKACVGWVYLMYSGCVCVCEEGFPLHHHIVVVFSDFFTPAERYRFIAA